MARQILNFKDIYGVSHFILRRNYCSSFCDLTENTGSGQGLASMRFWCSVSQGSPVGCGHGISTQWKDGKIHNLLLL